MTIVFTRGEETFSPWDRIGFEADQEAATVEHVHLDGSVGYSLGPDRPRRGRWRLFFLDAASAEEARAMLARPGPWVVSDSVPAVEMTVVRWGSMSQVQQDNRARWMLEVGFSEVLS